MAALAATAAIVGFGVSAVKTFVEFDTGMREVFTLMPELSAEAKKQMTADVKDLSEEIAVLPTDVIPALYQAISAGVPKENVFTFLEIAGKASIAGVTELSVAVDGLTSVTNAYGEEVISAEEVASTMFVAVKRGKTTFEELSARMFQAVPIASKIGLSFKNVAGAAAQITLAGVPMRVAMTQIRALLNEVAFEGKELNKVFTEAAGVSFQEFVAAGGDIADIIEILEDAAADAGVSVAELTSNLEAQQAMLNLSGIAVGNLRDILAEMTEETKAHEKAYEEMAAGIQYQLNELKVWWQNLKLDIGEDLAEQMGKLLTWLQDNQKEIGDRIKAIFDGIIDGLEWLSRNGGAVKIALMAIAAGFTAIWVAANPVAAVIAGIVAGFVAISSGLPSFEADLIGLGDAFGDAGEKVGLLDLAIHGLIAPVEAVRDMIAPLTGNVRASASAIENLANRVWLLNESFENMEKAGMLSSVAAADLKAKVRALYEDLKDAPDLEQVMQHWPTALNNILNEWTDDFPLLQRLLEEIAATAVEVSEDVEEAAEDTGEAIAEMVAPLTTGAIEAAEKALEDLRTELSETASGSLDYIVVVGNIRAEYAKLIAAEQAVVAQGEEVDQRLLALIGGYEALGLALEDNVASTQSWGDAVKDIISTSLADTLWELGTFYRKSQDEEKDHQSKMAGIIKSGLDRIADLNKTAAERIEDNDEAHRRRRRDIQEWYDRQIEDGAGGTAEKLLALQTEFARKMQDAETDHADKRYDIDLQLRRNLEDNEADQEELLAKEKTAYEQQRTDITDIVDQGFKDMVDAIVQSGIDTVVQGVIDNFWALATETDLAIKATNTAVAGLDLGPLAALAVPLLYGSIDPKITHQFGKQLDKVLRFLLGIPPTDTGIPSYGSGGIVPGPRGERRVIVAHGHEQVLTPEQREGMRIDYRMIGTAVENGVYDAMTDVLGRQPNRPLVLNVEGRQMARALFNPFMEENDRRGGVIVTA